MTRALSMFGPVIVVVALFTPSAAAAPITFEGPIDSELITDQFADLGVTFENAIISTYEISINAFDWDPVQSGVNALSDFGGVMRVLFDAPVARFSAFFGYAEQLTLQAYLNGIAVVDLLAMTQFESNDFFSGNAANEFVLLEGLFDEVQIAGTSGFFGVFFLDDLEFTAAPPAAVPEPGSLILMTLGAAGVLLRRRRSG